MISRARRPLAANAVKKPSRLAIRWAFEVLLDGTPKAIKIACSNSLDSSCVLTTCAATT